MGRQAEQPNTAAGRAIWKALEKVGYGKYSTRDVFTDWLDLMLNSYLAFTMHIEAGNTGFDIQNAYNDAYMEIVAKYADNQPKGSRAIDFLSDAHAALALGVREEDGDPLGDLYMSAISFGEHGQFFTPFPIAEMMARMTMTEIFDGQTVADPSGCGSGVMFLAAAKINPRARFFGVDLDPRCAQMCALNLLLRELTGRVYCGNGLSGEMYTEWNIRHGWITRNDNPEPIAPRKDDGPAQDKRGQLLLL